MVSRKHPGDRLVDTMLKDRGRRFADDVLGRTTDALFREGDADLDLVLQWKRGRAARGAIVIPRQRGA